VAGTSPRCAGAEKSPCRLQHCRPVSALPRRPAGHRAPGRRRRFPQLRRQPARRSHHRVQPGRDRPPGRPATQEGAVMSWIAWKMLTGDRSKYIGIIFGVAFASLLMAHQVSIFCGIMRRTTSQIADIHEANLWVMDPKVQYVEEAAPLHDTDLHRVRGVPGVEWAVRLYKGLVRARMSDGNFRQVVLLGLDDA